MQTPDNGLSDIVSLGQARSAGQLVRDFDTLLARHGARDASIGFFSGADHIQLQHSSAGSEAWRIASLETGLIQHCPSVRHTRSNAHASIIENIQASAQSEAAKRAVELARECGILHGLVVPVHMQSGEKGGVAMLADQRLERRAVSILTAAAIVVHGRFESLVGRDEEAVTLTDRERDVLAWMAEGKQAVDVAALLDISLATVMFHSRQAQMKLGTSNRTHTVAEAIRRGLLFAEAKRS